MPRMPATGIPAPLPPRPSPPPARGLIRRVVLIGPSHFVRFCGIAAPPHKAFATPLGSVPVDTDAVAALVRAGLAVVCDAPHAREHALEVELPFLQARFGNLPTTPLLFGEAAAEAVADAIDLVWSDDTLLVVSSDLSHFEAYASARAHDARTAAAIERFAEREIGPADACGYLAIRGALIVARRRRLRVERLALANSGDVSGDLLQRRWLWCLVDQRAGGLKTSTSVERIEMRMHGMEVWLTEMTWPAPGRVLRGTRR